MKRIFTMILSAAVILMMASCGGKGGKKAAGNDGEVDLGKVVENIEKQTFDGDKNTKDASAFYFKKLYGLDIKDVTPDFELTQEEPGKYDFLGDPMSASYATFKSGSGKLSDEEIEAYVKKAYAATQKFADNGKNVYGWMFADKHDTEKPIDEILKGGYMDVFGFKVFVGNYGWSYVKDGIYYDVTADFLEKKVEGSSDKVPYGVRFTVGKGLQKSLDESMGDLEKALDDPEVQKQMKEAMKELSK